MGLLLSGVRFALAQDTTKNTDTGNGGGCDSCGGLVCCCLIAGALGNAKGCVTESGTDCAGRTTYTAPCGDSAVGYGMTRTGGKDCFGNDKYREGC